MTEHATAPAGTPAADPDNDIMRVIAESTADVAATGDAEFMVRLSETVLDDPKREPLHDTLDGCPVCPLAAEVADELAGLLDPLDTWEDAPAGDGVPGDTVLQQVRRIVAHRLHRARHLQLAAGPPPLLTLRLDTPPPADLVGRLLQAITGQLACHGYAEPAVRFGPAAGLDLLARERLPCVMHADEPMYAQHLYHTAVRREPVAGCPFCPPPAGPWPAGTSVVGGGR